MKKGKKWVKLIFFVLFFPFFISYLISETGYYEYNLQRKKNLTSAQMKEFEAAVEKGEKIDLNHYLEQANVDYSNSLTRSTVRISLKVNRYLKTFLKDGFQVFSKFFK